ncbi:MAG TPA: Uma2 family endonuclease [Cryptosporangiaceae bacterium]|nr:Uma2 family endonuclease [Cryptosporangiaceae bacterium]
MAHSAPYSLDDLFAMPDDGSRYEVLDGQLIVSPAPSVRHQVVGDRLRTLLAERAPSGVLVVTAAAVRCGDDSPAMIPDIVVAQGPLDSVGRQFDASAVLAVVEVVSPSTRRTDRVTKPAVYAAAGIPTFWRVELDSFRGEADDELPLVLVYRLNGETYELVTRLPAGTPGTVSVPYPLRLDPAALLA